MTTSFSSTTWALRYLVSNKTCANQAVCGFQLASIPHDVKRYSLQVANSIDRQVDSAATTLRDSLSQQSWIPSSVRPSRKTVDIVPTRSLTGRVQDWMISNRALSAAVLAFAGTTCVLYFGNKTFNGKRRKARRAGNGARKEIVGMSVNLGSGWK